jgi:ribosomal-protein-serine acetyltransferase
MFQIKIDKKIRLELTNFYHADKIFKTVDRNRKLFSKWLIWVDETKSIEDTKKFIQLTLNEYAQNKQVNCCIFYKDKLVGNIALLGMKNKSNDTKKGEIGYWLDGKYHKKGIMRKCVFKMLDIGFNLYNLDKISIRCATVNDRSCNIPTKLGFTHEGVLRSDISIKGKVYDGNIYSILRAEFKS